MNTNILFLSVLFVVFTAITTMASEKPSNRVTLQTETASFGLGWFWGIESRFGIIKGVIRTRVGYAGGTTPSPDYQNIGDHTETVQIDYDPEQISYSELLQLFWKSHQPSTASSGHQYRNAVFFLNKKQEQLAIDSKRKLEKKTKKPVKTHIVPINSFTLAEDYHQKYLLKAHAIYPVIKARFPSHEDFVDSTLAARLNGYIGGHGSRRQLLEEIDSFELTENNNKMLLKLVTDRGPALYWPDNVKLWVNYHHNRYTATIPQNIRIIAAKQNLEAV